MKKVQSGEGATDFGQSTGLTQDELLGRAEPTKADAPQKILDALAEGRQERESIVGGPAVLPGFRNDDFTQVPEPARSRSCSSIREEIESIIFVHWMANKDAGGFPRWIGNAADVIVGLIP